MEVWEMQHGMVIMMKDNLRKRGREYSGYIVVKNKGQFELYDIHKAERFPVENHSYQFRIATEDEKEEALCFLYDKANEDHYQEKFNALTKHYVCSSAMVMLLNNV
jgi:hypothetical protein